MSHYKSNLQDIYFNMFHNSGTQYGATPFQDFDEQTCKEILEEVNKLATEILAESYSTSDKIPPKYDNKTYTAVLPEDFKNAYQALMDAEWFRLDLPEELGGSTTPPTLRWAVAELLLGANPAMFFYMAGPLFAAILEEIGTNDQKQLAQHMVDNRWGATMVLTEPDAGSDVGAGRTTAAPQPDGTWHIEGVKRFITSGEHDLADNIIHFVLARPLNTEGAGGIGTKGLSLFLVPKYHTNFTTGELAERNGVYATNVEDKMGLKASTTCELTFGQNGTPAVGYLVGNRHTGIQDMFRIIEWARMMVGTKSMAQLSTAYLNALEYSKIRAQGADLTQAADKSAPKVTIVHHPDVKRMLMLMKAYSEGLRALVHYTAQWQDTALRLSKETADEQAQETAHKVVDFLLPIVKGFSSEKSAETLPVAMQILGGSGYLKDYPIEQYIRDQHIDKLYEGVTHIQAQDFLFRKIFKDQFKTLGTVTNDITEKLAKVTSPDLAKAKEELLKAEQDIQAMLHIIGGWAITSMGENPKEIYKVGENANKLLNSVGVFVVACLLLEQANTADSMLKSGDTAGYSEEYLEGKIYTAQFFIHNVLPEVAKDKHVISKANEFNLMQVEEKNF